MVLIRTFAKYLSLHVSIQMNVDCHLFIEEKCLPFVLTEVEILIS
jgi:hypothetical protein